MAKMNDKSSDNECAYAAEISSEWAKNLVPIEESKHCPNCGSGAVDSHFSGITVPISGRHGINSFSVSIEEFGKY